MLIGKKGKRLKEKGERFSVQRSRLGREDWSGVTGCVLWVAGMGIGHSAWRIALRASPPGSQEAWKL